MFYDYDTVCKNTSKAKINIWSTKVPPYINTSKTGCSDGMRSASKFKTSGIYNNYNESSRSKHPINYVSWKGAKEYCSYVGKSLPSEAEWKYVAYGSDRRRYP